MADDEKISNEEEVVVEKSSPKRKTPEKKQKKRETPPPMERRKSSRLQEKPTKKYAEDEDKVSDEDFTPSARSSSRGLKRKTSKGTRAKKAKTDNDQDEGDQEDNNEDVNKSISHSSSSSSSTQNPPSQDGLSNLSNNYKDIQSQDFSLQTYKRNQEYLQPLGKLTKEQVQQGEAVLDKIKQLLDSGDNQDVKIVDLSNQFYTIVPTQDQSLPPIKDKTSLEEKYNLLKSFE